MFAIVVDYGLFCSNNEHSWPIQSKTIGMCTTSNEKNKNSKNLIFTNLRWHFGSKKVKGKHTNRITGEVETKTICMLIQKLEKTPTPTTNNYKGLKAETLMDYGNYQQPWKLDSGASGHYCCPIIGVRNRQKK